MIGSGKPKTGRPKDGDCRSGRNRRLCIRLSDSDLKKLTDICDFYQVSKTDFIIDSILSEYQEKHGNNS